MFSTTQMFFLPIFNSFFCTVMFLWPISYGVYISQLIRFTYICNNVTHFTDQYLIVIEILKTIKTININTWKLSQKLYYLYKNLINWFNFTTFWCLSPVKVCISIGICNGLCCVDDLRWEVVIHFVVVLMIWGER